MNGFLVIFLASVVFAAPQYYYQLPTTSTFSASDQEIRVDNYDDYSGVDFNAADNGVEFNAENLEESSYTSPSTGFSSVPNQIVYNKQFFIHSAPEDDFAVPSDFSNNNSLLKKNLRVIIIKLSENEGLTNAALQLAKTASEDKTVVYVMNKETDLSELQNQLEEIQANNPSRPEVHFLSYKTPEEAELAQHSIQYQYDNEFDGPTQIMNDNIASSESFVDSLGSTNGLSSVPSYDFEPISNAYLPSERK